MRFSHGHSMAQTLPVLSVHFCVVFLDNAALQIKVKLNTHATQS